MIRDIPHCSPRLIYPIRFQKFEFEEIGIQILNELWEKYKQNKLTETQIRQYQDYLIMNEILYSKLNLSEDFKREFRWVEEEQKRHYEEEMLKLKQNIK